MSGRRCDVPPSRDQVTNEAPETSRVIENDNSCSEPMEDTQETAK